MKIYYVEYRYSPTEWVVDAPFDDYKSAEYYMKNQITFAKAGVAGSLNGYGEDDFRITEREYD